MAVFLAVFDNQYAKEKQEMLDTTFYKQVTNFYLPFEVPPHFINHILCG